MKFHVTSDGPRPCEATERECPVGGEHYSDKSAAQSAFEDSMKTQVLPTHSKSFTMPLSEATQKVVDKLTESGARPLIVGGSVRDQFFGKESKDIDFEVYGAHPDGSSLDLSDLSRHFPKTEGYSISEAGESFSVLKIRYKGEDFDVALPRTEVSTGEHHRDYETQHDSTMTFKEAASRRDFTINSMGYDPKTGELLDPYGGQEDLKKGILRHVGPAFSDDPLRSLRAVNFVSRFNLEVAPETEALCRELAPAYGTLAKERVQEEFDKVFSKGKYVGKAFGVLHDIGWAQQMPPFKESSKEELEGYGKILDRVAPRDRKAALAILMRDAGRPDPLKTLAAETKERSYAHKNQELYDSLDSGDWGRIVAAHRDLKTQFPEVTNTSASKLMKTLGRDTSAFKDLPETPTPAAVTGKWMIDKGFRPGPEMGRVIKNAQALQDSTGNTNPDWLLAEVQKNA